MDQDVLIFFGRFHPLVLHLPIGILLLAVILEALSHFQQFAQLRPAVKLTLMLGWTSSAVAAALGFLLAESGGYDESLLAVHKWSGVALVSLSLAAYVAYVRWESRRTPLLRNCYRVAMIVMVIALSAAGHFGGALTHGTGYLSQYMPDLLRKIVGLPPRDIAFPRITNLPEALVYEQIISPIFDARCASCHSESKSKDDLMLHNPEVILKGGEEGAVIVPGNAFESLLIKRILLPEVHEDHMPPKGKRQLTEEETALLVWWIDQQAPFDKTVADLAVNEEIQAVLNTLVDPNANKTEVELLLATEVPPADKETLDRLRSDAVTVRPITMDNSWLQARVREGYSGDSLLTGLAPLKDQLTWLDLANTITTDKVFSTVSTFPNLTRLHLQNTLITDQGIEGLKDLHYLEYLNLLGTDISDEGLQHLAAMKNLRKLYVWKTRVSKTGVEKLKESVPGLEVDLGIDVSQKQGSQKTSEAILKAPARLKNQTLTRANRVD
jgi:uncharacterized membrane protein